MILIEDKAQKTSEHITKNRMWGMMGVEVQRYPLPVGDYIIANEKVLDVIERKNKRNIEIKKMDFVGTYNVTVDTKQDIQELISDLCGKQHERFRDEAIFAQNNGIKLYILVDDSGGFVDKKGTVYNRPVTSVSELHRWVNPRLFICTKNADGKYVQKYPKATKGVVIQKVCETFCKKYDCEILFCKPGEAAKKVMELLGGENV